MITHFTLENVHTAQYVLWGPMWSGFRSSHQLRSHHSLGRKQLWFRKRCHPPSSCWAFRPLAGELSLQGHQGTSCLPPASSRLSPWRPWVQGKRTQGWTPIRTPASGGSALSPAGMTLVTSLQGCVFHFLNLALLPFHCFGEILTSFPWTVVYLCSSRCPSAVATRTATVLLANSSFSFKVSVLMSVFVPSSCKRQNFIHLCFHSFLLLLPRLRIINQRNGLILLIC